ncbi:MAG: 6-carboxytetrahydropterin synthase [Phycisphaerae bacterium]
MFAISVKAEFPAYHQVNLPDGFIEPLHAHNWTVKAEVCSENLDDKNMVMDFYILKQMLDKITAPLKNQPIGQIDYFEKNGQSAEILAKYIFENLAPMLPEHVKLAQIQMTEAPGCDVKYCILRLMQ